MNKFLKITFFLFSLVLFVYVLIPSPDFPDPPEGVAQSDEPADVETPFRRGYYTNLTRAEVIAHYEKQFNQSKWVPQIRLNYPPEEAQERIRDQTKSTFLEELVHPMRESIYINGYETKDTIFELKVDDVVWDSKIIIRYIPSNVYLRVLVVVLTAVSGFFLINEYAKVKKN